MKKLIISILVFIMLLPIIGESYAIPELSPWETDEIIVENFLDYEFSSNRDVYEIWPFNLHLTVHINKTENNTYLDFRLVKIGDESEIINQQIMNSTNLTNATWECEFDYTKIGDYAIGCIQKNGKNETLSTVIIPIRPDIEQDSSFTIDKTVYFFFFESVTSNIENTGFFEIGTGHYYTFEKYERGNWREIWWNRPGIPMELILILPQHIHSETHNLPITMLFPGMYRVCKRVGYGKYVTVCAEFFYAGTIINLFIPLTILLYSLYRRRYHKQN